MASSSNAHGSRKKKSSGVNKGKNDSLAVAKKSTSPAASDGRSSPDLTCSICLGQHENKCFTNNCLHEFCFKCLLEWSKVNIHIWIKYVLIMLIFSLCETVLGESRVPTLQAAILFHHTQCEVQPGIWWTPSSNHGTSRARPIRVWSGLPWS